MNKKKKNEIQLKLLGNLLLCFNSFIYSVILSIQCQHHQHVGCRLTGILSCLRITCQRGLKSPCRASLSDLAQLLHDSCLSTGNLPASSRNTFFYARPPGSLVPERGGAVRSLPSFHLKFITSLVYGPLSCRILDIIYGSQSEA